MLNFYRTKFGTKIGGIFKFSKKLFLDTVLLEDDVDTKRLSTLSITLSTFLSVLSTALSPLATNAVAASTNGHADY